MAIIHTMPHPLSNRDLALRFVQHLCASDVNSLEPLLADGVVAKWTFAPRLARMAPATGLSWLALPHTFRHIGMMFVRVVSGAGEGGWSEEPSR